jgi:FAD:protein FMN transferase
MSPARIPQIRRARPLLGTQVAVGIAGLDATATHHAIDRGFATIAEIHRLMSFHEPDSDVSRLNRDAAREPVQVHHATYAVLSQALSLSAATHGVFDIAIAPRLVAFGLLPRPAAGPLPCGTWRDIELLPHCRVRFRHPTWIDVGGIAKGYAVDCALAAMALPAEVQVVVNAGGDLRIAGPRAERILLRAPISQEKAAVIELQDGSLASSSGPETRRILRGRAVGPHIHGRTRMPIGTRSFATVLAADCAMADALTKVVLALGRKSEKLLVHFGATAHLYRPGQGWCALGEHA